VKILVCIDAEMHSNPAVQRAISMGISQAAEVSALHVIDPWLKKFYNELYSQGRREYLEYVEECLRSEAEQIRRQYDDLCLAAGLETNFKLARGEPITEILNEVREIVPDLLITGCKKLTSWGRFRSRNLPRRLKDRLAGQVAVISVMGESSGVPVASRT